MTHPRLYSIPIVSRSRVKFLFLTAYVSDFNSILFIPTSHSLTQAGNVDFIGLKIITKGQIIFID